MSKLIIVKSMVGIILCLCVLYEDGHYQAPKHVVVPYAENTLYSTNKYSCVRPVNTLYISHFIEHNGDDEPHDYSSQTMSSSVKVSEASTKHGFFLGEYPGLAEKSRETILVLF